ncbi:MULTISPECIES: AsmA family protein [unclassified Mesorhizobium]|uniref:AsmA family protein n=1 Tax=unclassified Mesorhizobium TaxID=325217 RepID=UPI0008E0F7DC|nr:MULTISPECIES: AsmA family protein [unclassified Mesorhizobium]RJG46359.1 AsmA family protein [Mesorhizobium sp. DCY119]SFU00098.1 AsmA protein [Mesorhizobium sp. YR577]
MPSPLVRRSIWVIGAAALIVGLIIAMLPLIASTRLVRDRIAYEMSSWSGYRVTIGSTPEIEVWPSFRAVLTNVAMTQWGEPDHPPVIEAERMEIKLSALAALGGNVVFSSASMIRPTLRVERTADGHYLPALPAGGRIASSVKATREAVAANAGQAEPGRVSSDPFGMVEVSDGRVTVFAEGKDREILTGVAGRVSWPTLSSTATLNVTGIWRGESVAIEASSAKPLMLFAGGEAPVTASLTAKPATASFDGIVKTTENPFVDGSVKFSAPSLRRMLEWSRADVSPGSAIGSLSIAGRMSGDAQRLKLENAEIGLDGNPGMGVLNASFADGVPSIAGTLAFETLDLRSFLAAFTPLAPVAGAADAAQAGPSEIDTTFANRMNLDLRLSAGHAVAGSVTLSEVAANVQVKNGLAAFDISDAAAFDGNLQAGIRFDRKPEGTQVEMRLLASDIEGGAFGAATGMPRLFPIGRGNISLIMKGPGRTWGSILDNAEGTISATFGPGALSDFDLAGFQKRSAEGGFFALGDVSKGTLPIDGAEFKASISRGVVKIDKAEAKSPQGRLWLTGIVPYVGRGLALSGGIVPPDQPAAQNGASPPVAMFFVGGSWSAPFISPIRSTPPALAGPAAPVQ